MSASHNDPFQAEDQFLGVFASSPSSGPGDVAAPLYAPLQVATSSSSAVSAPPAVTLHEDHFRARDHFLRLEVRPNDVAAAAYVAASRRGPSEVASVPRPVMHAPAQVVDWYTAAAMADGPAETAPAGPSGAVDPIEVRERRTRQHRTHRELPPRPPASSEERASSTASEAVEAVARPVAAVTVVAPSLPPPPVSVFPTAPVDAVDEGTAGSLPVLLQTRLQQESDARRLAKTQHAAAAKATAAQRKRNKEEEKAEKADGQAHTARKRRRRHQDHEEQAPPPPSASSDAPDTPSTDALPDYDPEEGAALLHAARTRQSHGLHGVGGADDDDDGAVVDSASAAVLAAEVLLAGEDEYVRMPYAFQQGPLPYWLQRTSELLFTQNTLGGCGAGSGELPVDTVLRQLRADLREAQQLREEVCQQKDEKPLRTRPAMALAQYDGHRNPYAAAVSPPSAHAQRAQTPCEEDAEEELGSVACAKPAVALYVAEEGEAEEGGDGNGAPPALHSTTMRAGQPKKPRPSHEAVVAHRALPLLSAEAEDADSAQPVLAQRIPLWRYRGAAQAALTELIDLLHSRIAMLEKQLDNDYDALSAFARHDAQDLDGHEVRPWRADVLSLPQQFGALGGPSSAGVDGRQAVTLPPAVEHAYATTVASTLMSDLFSDRSLSAFTDRSVRVADAFYAQLPAIHARYLIDEAARPVYDPTRTLRRPYPLPNGDEEDGLLGLAHAGGDRAMSGLAASAAETRQSYAIHIDYLRFHPAKSYTDVEKVLLGRQGATTTTTTTSTNNADTAATAANAGLDSHHILGTPRGRAPAPSEAAASALLNNNSSFASSLLTDMDPSMLPAASAQPLTASVAWLLVQALAVSAATRQSAVPFSLESFFVAHLLHQYEQYRLLVLNLHPDIKSRHFYSEQIAQLEAVKQSLVRGDSDRAVLAEDIEPLLQTLWTLCDTASRWERHHLRRMAELWNMVLIVRGQTPLPQESPASRRARHRQDSGSSSGAPSRHREGRPTGAAARATEATASSSSSSSHSWPWSASGDVAAPVAAAGAAHERCTTIDSPGVFASSSTTDDTPGSDQTPPGRTSAEAEAARSHALPYPYTSTALFDSPTPWRQTTGGRPALAGNPVEESFLFSAGLAETDPLTSDSAAPAAATASGTTFSRFRFYLTARTGTRGSGLAPPSVPVMYVPDIDDLLDFVPVVEGIDAAAGEAMPAQASAQTAAHDDGRDVSTGASVSTDDAPASQHDPRAALGHLRFFQAAVFVRSNAAMPPQYVGSTVPRPLTATNTLFFNETFEMRALQEPQEVLLHILPVSNDPTRQRRVLATVRIQPTLARRYRLFPLEPPVSFVFRGQLIARVGQPGSAGDEAGASTAARTPVGGVLAASTTWTSWRGLTLEQVEQVFLRRQADPLDPAHAPVLRQLRNYYAEMERNRREAHAQALRGRRAREQRSRRDRRLAVSLPPAPRSTRGEVRSASASAGETRLSASAAPLLGAARTASVKDLTALREASRRPLSRSRRGDQDNRQRVADEAAQTEAAYAVSRLACLQKRWLVASDREAVEGEMEARLYRYPIPLSQRDARELVKFIEREMALEASARRRSYHHLDLDEAAYHAGPASTSGLALSPLPKAVKLRLWQKRLEMSMLTRKTARDVSDVEKLAAVVTLPKFTLRMVAPKPPRSRLNPERKERPKTADIDRDTFTKKSRLVVHIMKAMNLPRRADGSPLEPFVEAGFVYETAYSRCELGTSPSWFQTLELPFEPPGLDEDTLDMIDDDLCIAIYDKVEVPMPSTTHGVGVVAHETHYRTERRLLGTLRIPFYSLHQAESARMEGVFPLRTPRWLLGYRPAADENARKTDRAAAGGGGGGAAAASGRPNPFATRQDEGAGASGTHAEGAHDAGESGDDVMTELHTATSTIQLYLSLWPPLQREKRGKVNDAALTRRVRELNVSNGLRALHDVALKWRKTAVRKIKSIAAMNPLANDRDIEPFVFCSTGDMMLACRYLLAHGGPPPASVTNVYEAIRFVSLLPFVTDVMMWGDKDVWSTNAELLAQRAGDYEELALLLAHLLRHLAPHRATYVVVGAGEIFAQTIMVLHSLAPQQAVLIDPRTGWLSAVEKPYGTVLKDVHFVLSHNQIWANLQLSGLPHRMNWDLGRPQYWLPCFDVPGGAELVTVAPPLQPAREQFDAMLSPIQRVNLDFTKPDPARAGEIGMALRSAVHKALTAWRHQVVPTYHRGVEGVLTELLHVAEQERCRSASVHDPAVTALAETKLREWFGEPIAVSANTTVRRRRVVLGQREGDDDDGTAGAVPRPALDTAAGRRQERSCLHLVGSPAMSSYNPKDTEFHHLIQQVFETAVHEVGTDDVSFAIGVYVKSYTADVFAMWAFVAAIYRGVQVVRVEDDEDE